jgi:hypothetical protein
MAEMDRPEKEIEIGFMIGEITSGLLRPLATIFCCSLETS